MDDYFRDQFDREYIGDDGISVIVIKRTFITFINSQDCVHSKLLHIRRDKANHQYLSDLLRHGIIYNRYCTYESAHSLDGHIEYYHCIDGPAVIEYGLNNSVICDRWYKDGKVHRNGLPAVIYYKTNGGCIWNWYINGRNYSPIIDQWISENADSYGISKFWWRWSNDDRIIFKLVFDESILFNHKFDGRLL